MPSFPRSLTAAVALPLLMAGNCVGNRPQPPSADAPQGWGPRERAAWYMSSQGSRLIPQIWLTSLEQPDTQAPFLAPDYIASFRYLPMLPGNWSSPDGCPRDPRLPLGFTADCQSDAGFTQSGLHWRTKQGDAEPWVGMNCSACHTNQIEYQGQPVVIDGAPTLADFQSFMEKLQLALKETLSDPAKFTRFSLDVLGVQPDQDDIAKLRDAMTRLITWNDRLERLNNPKPLRYGFGRLDAIGHIFNKVALSAVWPTDQAQTPNPADAPVSYPFLWNVPQLDKVEWNGINPNSSISFFGRLFGSFNYGGLARNTGEVIGVFADIELKPNAGLGGYASSARIDSLSEMENQLGTLYPPAWPVGFPKIDPVLAKTGQLLFDSKHCSKCHATSEPNDLNTRFTVTLNQAFPTDGVQPASFADRPVNTDIWMACNAVMDPANTGVLKGSSTELLNKVEFGDRSPLFPMVVNSVIGALAAKKGEVVISAAENLFGFARALPEPRPLTGPNAFGAANLKANREKDCRDPAVTDPTKVVYKARPLQGIWATAPYLHNGSVPSLYTLLLPQEKRPTKFFVGSPVFDPKEVGFEYKTQGPNTFEFDVTPPLVNGMPSTANGPVCYDPKERAVVCGNSNWGHDYDNALLTDADRNALIEYMKTL